MSAIDRGAAPLAATQIIVKRATVRQLANPLFIGASMWNFALTWFRSRPWRALIAGLPAILGMAAVVCVVLPVATTNASRFKWRYELALREAVKGKNTEAESLWRRTLMEMDPQNSQFRYEWALRCDEQGLKEQAEQTMLALAAGPEGGFAPAHLWIADRALKQSPLSESALRAAIGHLEAVLKMDADSPPANAMLAQALLNAGQEDKAEPYLMKAIQWFPHLRVPLAQILVKRQKIDSARWQLQQATEDIRTRLAKNPKDSESRLAMASAFQALGRPEAAEEVLLQAANDDDPRIKDRLAMTTIAKAARLRSSRTAADVAKRREAMVAAYQYSPNSAAVLQELLLLLTDSVPLDKAFRDRLETDLNSQLTANPQQPLVHALLGFVLLQGNRERPAIEQLRIATKQDPQYATALARVLRERGQEADSQQSLKDAVSRLSSAAKEKPQDLSLRMAWADAELQLQHWTEAKQVLQDAYAANKDARCLQALSQVLVSEHDAVPAGDGQSQRQLALLREALTHWPESPYALARFSELSFRDDPVGEEARAALLKQRTSGARSQVLQLLGVAAAKLGKNDLAVEYFTHVACLEVADPFIQNNLAFALADQNPPKLQRALELVDTALQKSPEQGEFHNTRGVILLKLQRWSDAVKDLEAALQSGLDRTDVHESLAAAYTQLNQSDLAEQHRQKAAALKEPGKSN